MVLEILVLNLICGINEAVDVISHRTLLVRLDEVVACKQWADGIISDDHFSFHQF